jgi:hypothetical protein
MTWPISHDNEGPNNLNKIPITTLFRWLLYDITSEDAPLYSHIFDLTPVSEEGNLKEQNDSDIRVENITDIVPLLTFYATATAEFAFNLHKTKLVKVEGITEDMVAATEESFKEFYYHMIFAGLMGSYSALKELDIIKLNSVHTSIQEGEL